MALVSTPFLSIFVPFLGEDKFGAMDGMEWPLYIDATLENMYVTPNIFGVEQHQEQLKNNRSIVLRQLAWRKPLA